jgi:hypothetical protein
MGRVAFLEKFNGDPSDWTPTERECLNIAGRLLGVDARVFPAYPVLDHADPVIARQPGYALYNAFDRIGDLCAAFLFWLHRPIANGTVPHEILDVYAHPEEKARLYQKFFTSSYGAELLKRAREPLSRDLIALPILTRHGAKPWHELPRLILDAQCGYSRKWIVADLLGCVYHGWRTSPRDVPSPQPPDEPWAAYVGADI